MRSDPALCFKALCGEELPRLRLKKKGKALAVEKVGGATVKEEDSEASDSGEEDESEGEMESGPSTPSAPSGKRYEVYHDASAQNNSWSLANFRVICLNDLARQLMICQPIH